MSVERVCDDARGELAQLFSTAARGNVADRNEQARGIILRAIQTIEREALAPPDYVAEVRRRFEALLSALGMQTH